MKNRQIDNHPYLKILEKSSGDGWNLSFLKLFQLSVCYAITSNRQPDFITVFGACKRTFDRFIRQKRHTARFSRNNWNLLFHLTATPFVYFMGFLQTGKQCLVDPPASRPVYRHTRRLPLIACRESTPNPLIITRHVMAARSVPERCLCQEACQHSSVRSCTFSSHRGQPGILCKPPFSSPERPRIPQTVLSFSGSVSMGEYQILSSPPCGS